MTMVDNGEELVLQWTGHSAHVTERFSELLARQALVDVTLICQRQKLRVHKLVLATYSLYFEEILEQDLGQEPIILLRDLDFDVLKAMVEFMYCGETTISQCRLQTLLEAARVFKVKELKCIIESMIKPKQAIENFLSNAEDESLIIDIDDINRKNYKGSPSVDNCDVKKISSDFENDEILKNNDVRKVDDNSRVNYTDDDNSLYEITEKNDNELSRRSEKTQESSNETSFVKLVDSSSKMSMSDYDDDENNELMRKDEILRKIDENSLNSFCNETLCSQFIEETESRENHFNEDTSMNVTGSDDLPSAIGECSRVYTHKKRKFIDNDEYNDENMELAEKMPKFDDNRVENIDNTEKRDNTSSKSLKVYTHKRRESIDDKKSQIFNDIRETISETNGTSSIDLNDDKTSNDTNLSSDLDMETSEYIWSLSAENIQYVVGCTINTPNVTVAGSEMKNNIRDGPEIDDRDNNSDKTSGRTKKLFSCDNENAELSEMPVLRRSVRINQLENDDSLNNNNDTINISKEREKSLERDKNDYENKSTINVTRSRRRANKDDNYRIIDENNIENPNSIGKTINSQRSLRSRTKLSSRKSNISRDVSSRDDRTKITRQNREKNEKIVSSDIFVNTRLNTIASVDRALWGDMSDVLDNREDSIETFMNYSTSREIPFAVGLLPLRAALERMQATLDHQPRKTRSSVAPLRQDTTFNRKKCTNNDEDNSTSVKKQTIFHDDNIETAVCHIEIRTSSGGDVIENPRVSTDERIIVVGENAKINEQ